MGVEDSDDSDAGLCSSDEEFADEELCECSGDEDYMYSSDEEWLRGPGSVATLGAVVGLGGDALAAAAAAEPAAGAPRARGAAPRARVPLGRGWDAVCVTCGEPHGLFGCEQLDAEMEAEADGLWMFE